MAWAFPFLALSNASRFSVYRLHLIEISIFSKKLQNSVTIMSQIATNVLSYILAIFNRV